VSERGVKGGGGGGGDLMLQPAMLGLVLHACFIQRMCSTKSES
jgi:hypothetical protein